MDGRVPLGDDVILEFKREYRFLSNFAETPMTWRSFAIPTAEHAFQCEKTTVWEWKERILTAPTPLEAKRLGRKAPIRRNWENIKLEIMRIVVHKKFENEALEEKLVETWPATLVEGNTWGDTFWGTDLRCNGANWLGVILMLERSKLMKARKGRG